MINAKGHTADELSVTNESITNNVSLRFYDVRSTPEMRIYGVMDASDGHLFCRIPEKTAKEISDMVSELNYHTAGGRIRFVTTSEYVAVKTLLGNSAPRHNGSALGAAGFDVYMRFGCREVLAGVIASPMNAPNGFDGIVMLPPGKKEITVNLPPYNRTSDVYIGLDMQSELFPGRDYTLEQPILYCGSSITQGGCASRPGMTYEAIISRKLDTNYINLGFSGSFKAEDKMIEYIASLEPSVLVMDYDHNAPTAEYLEQTHEKLYATFRKSHPDTPVIMVGKPDFRLDDIEDIARRSVIFKTYKNALARGENVLFIDGYSLFAGDCRDNCTVDGIHPNDLGMLRMADVIGRAIEYALSK